VATYLDDGRSYVSGNTYGVKEINNSAAKGPTSGLSGFTANMMFSKTPTLSEKV
jgi:hypothetical protein